MSSFTSQAIKPFLPIMTLKGNNLTLPASNSLSPVDIAKINRKYVCKDNRYKKYDKGDGIQNAISWKKLKVLKK